MSGTTNETASCGITTGDPGSVRAAQSSVAYRWCAEGSTKGLSEAIERFYRELPGWWFSLGNCSLSADATIGPDATGPDADLLKVREFDEGIDGNLAHPATLAEALNNAIDKALVAKAERQP